MAEVREVTASVSVRVNTGNYEGTEFFTSVRAELGDFEDPQEATKQVQRVAEQAMLRQLHRSYKVRGKKTMEDVNVIARHHGLTYAPAK